MKIIISCLSSSSFFQQPNRKKIWQRKTNDWGTPTTENKGKYFSLISKPCLCRQTLTVVYPNKPIPPLLHHWIRNAEVQSKYVDYSWLWNIVPGSPVLWKPLWAPFFWVCVCCALWQWHPRHSNRIASPTEHSLPESALQRCWNELPPGTWEELVAAHQDYPWEPHEQLRVSPILKRRSAAQPQLFPRIRWKRQAEVGLKVTLAGKESAAARGSSRTDGDIYIGNKRENS